MKEVSLASILTKLESGSRPKGGVSKDSGEIPSLGGEHINNQGGFNLDNLKFIPIDFYVSLNSGKIKEKDILIVKDGATTGKTSFVKKDFPFQNASINEHVFRLEINQDVAEPRFVFHFLFSNVGQSHILRDFRGATVGGISRGFINKVFIPLPPLAEQKRIAEVLDKADALREKRRRALQKLDTLLQSVFLEMFGDPVKNPKGWKKGTLGDVIYSAKDGPHVSPEYVEDGIHFLSTRHIRPGKVVWEDLKFISLEDAQIHWKKCKPEKGDILYTKGGTTGIAAIVDFDQEVAVWVHVALLKTNHNVADTLWLENMLNSDYCYVQSQRYTHGIANRDLGLKRMVNIDIYIPPLAEQKKFSNFAMKLKEVEKKNLKALENSENLFQSLQQKAFKGELFSGNSEVELNDEKKVWQQTSLF